MQTNIVLIPLKGKALCRVGIQLHYSPYEWNGSSEGEIRTILLDSYLEINPKHWNYKTQRPFKKYSHDNRWYHHYMIEVQLKKAQEVFEYASQLMIEGEMCSHMIQALYTERTNSNIHPIILSFDWNIQLS